MFMKRTWPPTRGMTLIELLVVIAIIAVIASLAFPVFQSAASKARMTKEMQAGRTLVSAFVASAADHDGQFPAGYDRTVSTVTLQDGTAVSGPPAERYPYRLAPYYQYQFKDTLLVSNNSTEIDTSSNYLVSCYPSLGINYLFVGGDVSATGAYTYPGEAVTRQAMAASILVFASAAGDSTPSKINGYCILTPPQTTAAMWSTKAWGANQQAASYGNVDPRYSRKAVCAFLDGSTRLLSIDELRDMRLWNTNALAQNNASYTVYVAPPPNGGRGGR